MRLYVILWNRPSREDRMCKLDEIMAKRDEIRALAQKYKVLRIFVFGSCARKEETPESDVDFLVEFQKGSSLFDHVGLRIDLAEYLKRPVDVISLKALKDEEFDRNVKKEMVLL